MRKLWIFLWAVFSAAILIAAPENPRTFENPLAERGADPWFTKRGKRYYYCKSAGNHIRVGAASEFPALGKVKTKEVWRPPQGTAYSRNLWAPELYYLDGNWYIYVAADDGENKNHRMYVLKGTSQDPTKPFEFVGKISTPDDHWAIDGTVLEHQGKRYFIWSGWQGGKNGSQELYIARMETPVTLTGTRVRISKPDRKWEKRGMPIQEGPAALYHNDDLFLIYSGSGSWTDHYCLGALKLTGNDPMNPEHWTKLPEPILKKSETLFGPGHCSFVPSGGKIWCIYHGNRKSGTGWKGRSVLAQPVNWDGSGNPVLDPAAGFGSRFSY